MGPANATLRAVSRAVLTMIAQRTVFTGTPNDIALMSPNAKASRMWHKAIPTTSAGIDLRRILALALLVGLIACLRWSASVRSPQEQSR